MSLKAMPLERAFTLYFTSPYALAILGATVAAMTVLALVFLWNDRRPSVRLRVLSPLLTLGLFLWGFMATSAVLCVLEKDHVEYTGGLRILTAAAFFASLGLTIGLSSWLWRTAAPRLLRRLEPRLSDAPPGVGTMLEAVASRAGMRPPGLHLLDVPEPISLAAVGRKGYIILSRGLLDTLDGEELEAVLAHEAMHLKNDDSRFKVFASTLSAILFFDPLTRLVDAAAHREREYLADEAASRVTGRPASLAAALLKLSTYGGTTTGRIGALSVLGSYGRLLSRHPPLGERLSRLLALAEVLKPPGGAP